MFSIGQLSKLARVKIPTIRYYENIGLLESPDRSSGNQRRYDRIAINQLTFIKHARDLGFSIDAISQLLSLEKYSENTCEKISLIAQEQLKVTQNKIEKLNLLKHELERMTEGCAGDDKAKNCYILQSLADHRLCETDH